MSRFIYRKPVIGVVGASVCDNETALIAEKVGKSIGMLDCYCLCGGLGGVMEAAAKGAKDAGTLTIGIIPGFDADDVNPYIDIPIVTGLSHARNIVIVRSSDIITAIGGGYGTLSEIAIALKIQKPVIGLNTWEIEGIIRVDSVEKLEDRIKEFLKTG